MEEIVPTEFELAQNYPNPFEERTTIKYCVPEKMRIKLELFHKDGKKIKTLVDDLKEAGTHKIELNMAGFDEGEYLYKLESRDFFDAKRMIVLR